MASRKVTRDKVTVEKDGVGTMGQERREVHVTVGKMKGSKEVKLDMSKGKSMTGMMTGRKEAGQQGTSEKAAQGEVNDQVDAKRRSYCDGALRTERVFMDDSILRKTEKTLSKGEDVVVCLPRARIEHITKWAENTLGHGQGGSIFADVGTNNADREGTTSIVQIYRQLVGKLKRQ